MITITDVSVVFTENVYTEFKLIGNLIISIINTLYIIFILFFSKVLAV